jgi:hypothetical protein
VLVTVIILSLSIPSLSHAATAFPATQGLYHLATSVMGVGGSPGSSANFKSDGTLGAADSDPLL